MEILNLFDWTICAAYSKETIDLVICEKVLCSSVLGKENGFDPGLCQDKSLGTADIDFKRN